LFRKRLSDLNLKFEENYGLLGKPDIVFPSKKVVVFLDSCFWHGCKKHLRMPKSNKSYWTAKIRRNVERDKYVTSKLKKDGWAVVRLWEHEINNNLEKCMTKVLSKIK
jgi:DNA mismatch endonuclease (patch repair protein)